MKKRILLLTAIAGMISLTMSSYLTGPANNGYDCTGAESASTGTYANPTGCASGGGCHNSSATATVSVNIELDSAGIATTRYVGGNTYTVKISGNNGTGTAFPFFGFQLTSIKGAASAATVSNAGTWSAYGLPARTRLTAPGHYTQLDIVEHSDTIELINDTFSRSFTWTAPAAGTGTISFWGAANFINGSYNTTGTPSIQGDLWNTNHITITEETRPSGIATVTNDINIKAFPNPISNNLSLQMDNAATGDVSISIFNLNGEIVAQQQIAGNNNNALININTSCWMPGIYEIVVEQHGNRRVIPVIKQ